MFLIKRKKKRKGRKGKGIRIRKKEVGIPVEININRFVFEVILAGHYLEHVLVQDIHNKEYSF